MAVRRLHLWIAAIDALVVLTLRATLLPLTVLYWFPDEHASMANRGFPVFLCGSASRPSQSSWPS